MKTDICIVGGGIIGLFSAYELSARGLKVCLIDRGDFGAQCTAAAGGILSPLLPWDYSQDVNDLCHQAKPLYEKLDQRLATETGINIEYQNSGLLVLNDEHIDTHSTWCNDHHIICQPAAYSNPNIASGLYENALLLPEVSQLNPARVVEGLCQLLLETGVKLYQQTEVEKLLQQQGQITGLRCSHGDINAEAVLWTTGAWMPELALLTSQALAPAVRPVRGQAIAFDATDLNLEHIIIHQGHYLIPRQDGTILAGSTLEEVGYNNNITQTAKNNLLQRSIAILPELKNRKILRQWSGLRPASASGQPLIGAVAELPGLFVNAGHHRYGVTMAGSSSVRVADQIQYFLSSTDSTAKIA